MQTTLANFGTENCREEPIFQRQALLASKSARERVKVTGGRACGMKCTSAMRFEESARVCRVTESWPRQRQINFVQLVCINGSI